MKNIKNINFSWFAIIMFGVLTLSSCGADFLEDVEVYSDLNADTYYQTAEHAEAAVIAAYTPLQYQGLYRRLRYLLDYMSGDFDITSGGRQLTAYPGFQFNSTTSELIPKAWEACYIGIGRTNTVLQRVPDIEVGLFDSEEQKNYILGQAYFLRGLYYFNLVRLYGGVPIYTEPFDGDLNGDQFQPARNTVEEVYDLIESDFEMATTMLPNSWDGDNTGKATAGAAQAFLGKVHLYQNEYSEAKDVLARVINGEFGTYSLIPDFEQNFLVDNENNAESIFEVQFEQGSGAGFIDKDDPRGVISNWMSIAVNPGRQGFANAVPSVAVDDFFSQFPEEEAVRRPLTIAKPGDTWGNWDPIAADPVAAGQWRDRAGERPGVFLGCRKHNTGGRVGFVQDPMNFRVMRYAEVLLLFAEAENEVNGPTAEAYDAINEVRTRAQVSDIPAGLSKEEFFEQIVIERRLELTFEFQRFFDLVRWGRRANTPDIASPTQMPGFVAGKNELLPIPQEEILRNPNLVQNPNY
ncbi:RagB/SusD family nutrient uptake outer membrane protein [Marinigracilibium pacificum]|uniref:RagB/SusD family nutrient uptake outer membrane protein n=1 Tax=Marinigracilibium pacificum TaxID=2729599 RepID=A0A848J223_9BACT|nr:RagB/SusD family nutrient uptake outer membrane protein [Marinigracilibium pacificum]NMM48359.1 RagB/SusD family nutrient uptake outer membrane protein [Marinigracilibium pacificum]